MNQAPANTTTPPPHPQHIKQSTSSVTVRTHDPKHQAQHNREEGEILVERLTFFSIAVEVDEHCLPLFTPAAGHGCPLTTGEMSITSSRVWPSGFGREVGAAARPGRGVEEGDQKFWGRTGFAFLEVLLLSSPTCLFCASTGGEVVTQHVDAPDVTRVWRGTVWAVGSLSRTVWQAALRLHATFVDMLHGMKGVSTSSSTCLVGPVCVCVCVGRGSNGLRGPTL